MLMYLKNDNEVNEVHYKVTPTFKKAVRRFVERTYGVNYASNQVLKKLFKVDLRLSMSWLKIYGECDDRAVAEDIKNETKSEFTARCDFEIKQAAKKYGVSVNTTDYFSYTVQVLMKDAKGVMRNIGEITNSSVTKQWRCNWTRNGSKPCTNLNQAFAILVSLFKKYQPVGA
jgi:hypothetical protein